MPVYMRPDFMQTGIGIPCLICDKERSNLRCPNCNNLIIEKIDVTGTLSYSCPKCKAHLYLNVKKMGSENGKKGVSVKARSKFNIAWVCNRCKSYFELRVREALPWVEKREDVNEEVNKERINQATI